MPGARGCPEAVPEQGTLPKVEITCDNGKIYSTFLSGSDHAIVWGRNLKARFHGSLWLGTLDVKAVGSKTGYAQTVVEGALAWVLPAGQYEAVSHAASTGEGSSGFMRSSFGARSSLGGPSRAFTANSAFKTARQGLSVHVASAQPAKTGRTAGRIPVRIDENEEVTSSMGGGDLPEADARLEVGSGLSGAGHQSEAGLSGAGRQSEEGHMSSGLTDTPAVGGSVRRDDAVAGARGAVESGGTSFSSSVLRSNVGEKHPVRVVFQEYADRREAIPRVPYVPKQLDGNKIFVRPKGAGLRDSIAAGPHWGKCKTTNMRLKAGEPVRYWDCKGGHRCVNENCWYRKEAGRVATTAFETEKETGEPVCKFCKQRAMSTGPCYAKRFHIEGKEEFAHVHFGQHNHDLCDTVSQEIMEKWQVEAMKAAAKDPKLTASIFTQNQVREAIL
jgi:hypothetical protein